MIGQTIGTYQINEFIGEGGMGSVFRATDKNLHRQVAIKMLHVHLSNQPNLLSRFENEALMSAKINHPNVATLYQFLKEGDRGYLVMEYIEGQNLEKLLEKHGSFSLPSTVQVLLQLAEGLNHAHSKGIIHRDIKPGNIMLNREGYIKLMDFGIARIENSARMTRLNHVIGTTPYLAPELLQGAEPSVQTDLYALGILAYELYYGKTPFTGKTDSSLIHNIIHDKPDFTRKTKNGDEQKFIKIVKQLIQKNPQKRTRLIEDLIRSLEQIGFYKKISIVSQGDSDAAYNGAKSKQNRTSLMFFQKLTSKASVVLPRLFQSLEGRIIGASIALALLLFTIGSINVKKDPIVVDDQNNYQPLQQSLHNEPFENQPLNFIESIEDTDEDAQLAPEEPILNALTDHEKPADAKENQEDTPEKAQEKPEELAQDDEGSSKPDDAQKKDTVVATVDQNDQGETETEQKQKDTKDLPDEEVSITTESLDNESITTREEIAEEKIEEEQKDEFGERHDEKPSSRSVSVNISKQFITVVFPNTLSSEINQKGQTVYLTNQTAVHNNGKTVIPSGSRIRAYVKEARSIQVNSKASLSIQIEAVEAIDGTWIALKYPEYSNRSDEPIIFQKGTTLNRVMLKNQIVTLNIPNH